MRRVTEKQQKVLEAIKKLTVQKGVPPTVREVASAIGVRSSCTAQRYIDALERHGLLTKSDEGPRKCTPANMEGAVVRPSQIRQIPLVGQIAAGQPILAETNIEDYLPVPRRLIGDRNAYFLRIKGDSMTGAGIFDGDQVLVVEDSSPQVGQIVAALVGDEATVKRWTKKGEGFVLKAENPAHSDIPFTKDAKVLGRVVMSVRSF